MTLYINQMFPILGCQALSSKITEKDYLAAGQYFALAAII